MFRAGTSSDPAGWSAAPNPTISLARGAGSDGSDRVTLVWPDGAIRNTWLRVTMLATARTALAAPDVFYFGSLVGETGDNAASATVDVRDVTAVRGNFGTVAARPARDRFDINRDGRVDAIDLSAVRAESGPLAPTDQRPRARHAGVRRRRATDHSPAPPRHPGTRPPAIQL